MRSRFLERLIGPGWLHTDSAPHPRSAG